MFNQDQHQKYVPPPYSVFIRAELNVFVHVMFLFLGVWSWWLYFCCLENNINITSIQ